MVLAILQPIASAALGSGSFEVCVSLSSDIYTIQSTGLSADGSAQRILTQSIAQLPSTSAPPSVPIVAKGAVGFGGNAKIYNNLSDLTVWSGGDIGSSGGTASWETYINVDGTPNSISTSGTTLGPDVVRNDQNLGLASKQDIMQAFFGYDSTADLGATGVTLSDATSSNDGKIDKDLSGIIYETSDIIFNASSVDQTTLTPEDYDSYEASCPASDNKCNTTIIKSFGAARFVGTPDEPVILVFEGNPQINASLVIFGVVVVNGVASGNGGFQSFGGIVGLETVAFSGGPDIFLDKTVIDNAQQSQDFGPVKSSWKDW